jgi:hypothetical protein
MEICRFSDDNWKSDFDIHIFDRKITILVKGGAHSSFSDVSRARLYLHALYGKGLHVPDKTFVNLKKFEDSND